MHLIILILQEHYESDITGEDLKNLDNALKLDLLESAKISQNIPKSPRISQKFPKSLGKVYLIIPILQEHYEGDIKGEDLKNLDNALELDLLEFALDHEEEDLEDEDENELEEWKPSITNNPNKLPLLVPIKKIEKPRQCDKVSLKLNFSILTHRKYLKLEFQF